MNALHNLCFYHLVVQKWKRLFPANLSEEDQKFVDLTYQVLWDWAYYVETELEWSYSEKALFDWMQTLMTDPAITPALVTTGKNYILQSLQPYYPLWLNHKRGQVPGMGKRTSNLAEAMHWSMKSGPHAVSARLGTVESANAQMDKAQFLGKRNKRENANAAISHKQYGFDKVGQELTKYAETLSTKQWGLAQQYFCIALHKCLFAVYTRSPDAVEDVVGPRRRFMRVRLVSWLGGYMSCTCGFPAEYKMPCRHIFRVVGKRTGEMFGLRWLQCFQHCYDRRGFEDATATMREMLFEENTRRYNMNQHIRSCSATATFDEDVEFPAPVSGDLVGAKPMSEQLVQLGLLHYSLLAEGKLLVRVEPLPVVEQGSNMAGMDMDVEYSDEVARMLSQDLSAIQQSQEAVRHKDFVRKDEYGKKCMDMVKETLKLTEDSPQKEKSTSNICNVIWKSVIWKREPSGLPKGVVRMTTRKNRSCFPIAKTTPFQE